MDTGNVLQLKSIQSKHWKLEYLKRNSPYAYVFIC